jgi:deoxyadenosine/deoxycytidine kinase
VYNINGLDVKYLLTNNTGYQYYNELKAKALQAVPVPHILIYIDASPETCFERIHGRGRVRLQY